MHQTILVDNRIKNYLVLLPAFALMFWIAADAFSDDTLVTALALGAILIGLIFSAIFLKSTRFEAAVINCLLVGYLVGNRGFAELTLVKPLYPGEVCLALVLAAMLIRYLLSRETPDLSGTLSSLILIYIALGVVRLSMDFSTYKMDALRDSAMVYYSLYFFIGRELALRSDSKRILESCLRFSFILLVPIALIARFDQELLFSGALSLFFPKDDLLTTFEALAAFVLYTRPKIYPIKGLRIALIFLYLVLIVSGLTRASLAGLAVGSILFLFASEKKFFAYPLIAIVLGLTALAGTGYAFGNSNTNDPKVFIEKIESMVDVTGTLVPDTDFGQLKAENNNFRRTLWQSFFDETTAVSPVFGRGFGYDFLARYEDLYRLGEWQGLRSAHNFYVTLYGRMGILGVGLFLLITLQIIKDGIRAAIAVKAGVLPLADLSFWCGAWAILVAAVFGVVLEGPVGAIVFWLFLGVGTGSMQVAAAKHRDSALLNSSSVNAELILAQVRDYLNKGATASALAARQSGK